MHRRKGLAALACSAAAVLALPAGAAAITKTVYPGGPASWQNSIGQKYGAGVDSFMLQKVKIHVGDSVVWDGKARANGFHTVDFPGTAKGDLPLIVPTGGLVSGVNDFAGNPFWFNGKLPNLGFNPTLFSSSTGGTYNGSTRVDSGLPLGPPADFKLTFTKAGVYKYFCDVHPGMVGWVIVQKKGQDIPTAAQDAKALAKLQAADVKTAKKLDRTKPKGKNISLGASGPKGVEVLAMFPGSLTVKTGTTVRFAIAKNSRETHTASFGPQSYLKTLSDSFQGPAPSPAAIYPSDPPGTITLNATSHGNGFANVGAVDRDAKTPVPSSGTITFTQAGTYHFICLIHPFMHGTIVVK